MTSPTTNPAPPEGPSVVAAGRADSSLLSAGPSWDATAWLIAAFGLVVTAFTWWLLGQEVATAAFVGATLALLNWVALRWLVRRLLQSEGGAPRAATGILLTLKMAAILGMAWLALGPLGLNALGLTLGLSALVLASVIAGLRGPGAAIEGKD